MKKEAMVYLIQYFIASFFITYKNTSFLQLLHQREKSTSLKFSFSALLRISFSLPENKTSPFSMCPFLCFYLQKIQSFCSTLYYSFRFLIFKPFPEQAPIFKKHTFFLYAIPYHASNLKSATWGHDACSLGRYWYKRRNKRAFLFLCVQFVIGFLFIFLSGWHGNGVIIFLLVPIFSWFYC